MPVPRKHTLSEDTPSPVTRKVSRKLESGTVQHALAPAPASAVNPNSAAGKLQAISRRAGAALANILLFRKRKLNSHGPTPVPRGLGGHALVGHRLHVYFPEENKSVKGTVTSYDASLDKPYRIHFNGSKSPQDVALHEEDWLLASDDEAYVMPPVIERALNMAQECMSKRQKKSHPPSPLHLPTTSHAPTSSTNSGHQSAEGHPSSSGPRPSTPTPTSSHTWMDAQTKAYNLALHYAACIVTPPEQTTTTTPPPVGHETASLGGQEVGGAATVTLRNSHMATTPLDVVDEGVMPPAASPPLSVEAEGKAKHASLVLADVMVRNGVSGDGNQMGSSMRRPSNGEQVQVQGDGASTVHIRTLIIPSHAPPTGTAKTAASSQGITKPRSDILAGSHLVMQGPDYSVLRCHDPPGWELLVLVPGYELHEISIRAWPNGQVSVRASKPESSCHQLAMLWGIRPLAHSITLPGPVEPTSAQALLTLHGQLYVRINDDKAAEEHVVTHGPSQ